MALWSVALGFVVSLFVANEFVASDRMDRLAAEMSVNGEALLRTEEASALFERIHSLADESLTRAEDWALVDDMAKAMSAIAAAAQGEVRERALQAEALLNDVRGQAGTAAGQKLMRQWPTVHEDMHLALNKALVDIASRLKVQKAGADRFEGLLGAVCLLLVVLVVALEYRWLVRPIIEMSRALREGQGGAH
jgi:hypothetical protein